MAIRVAVVDPLPMFVRGLMATLSTEGVDPEAPEDLITWAAGKDRPAVLLTVLTPRSGRCSPKSSAPGPTPWWWLCWTPRT